ncbi:MAG: copper amine oxidase [Negativicutes bacterium]|nr:copper amine oxidase [Negativicutes bacterium]MDR3591848.1 copper amine oxidase [Negativicutes bacterium]
MQRIKWLVLTVALVLGMAGQALAGGADSGPGSLDILKLPEWQVTAGAYGGRLLLSDSPEMVPADGIMYQDTVVGDARLFFHHVNATTIDKRIVVLLENSGSEAAEVTVYRSGLAGPGADWLAVGKAAQTAYLADKNLYSVTVPARGTAQLSPELASAVVRPNMLVNGIFDFQTNRPVTVKVMMLPVGADSAKFARQAKVLPTDQYRLRGTFAGKDRLLIPDKVYDPAEDGAVVITLGDNVVDRYLEGIDATDGSKVLNYGNWGVVYHVFLPFTTSGKVACYLNPRGGTYAGALGVKYRHADQTPVATPAGRLFFGEGVSSDFAAIGKFGGNESLWLTFSPPGASNLPVKLVIMPGE